MAKMANDAAVLGERGIALIASIVNDMAHLWHPTSGLDSGIDGQIELRDSATGEVRNVRIAVQSKATDRKWPGETDTSFYYRPRPTDVAYWLSSNQPVLLICSRPSTGEAYWRSIQEWAQDLDARASGRVAFDKHRDHFSADTREALFDLGSAAGDRFTPPGAPRIPEILLANLMPIRWSLDRLYSAAVPGLNPQLLVEPAPGARDGRIWSLRPFSEALLDEARAEDLKEGPLDGWRESSHPSDLDLVRELVRRELIVEHAHWLDWNRWKELAYFKRQHNEDWQPVYYHWSPGAAGRAVVSPQKAKTREGFTSYRHDAAEIDVRRLGATWYVQIRPTYLFTWDGHQVSGHHDSALAAIKKLDRHATMSQMLRMWQHLFSEDLTLENDAEEPPISLGPLVECRAPQSIVDKTWLRISPADADSTPDEAQQSLFDFGDGDS